MYKQRGKDEKRVTDNIDTTVTDINDLCDSIWKKQIDNQMHIPESFVAKQLFYPEDVSGQIENVARKHSINVLLHGEQENPLQSLLAECAAVNLQSSNAPS